LTATAGYLTGMFKTSLSSASSKQLAFCRLWRRHNHNLSLFSESTLLAVDWSNAINMEVVKDATILDEPLGPTSAVVCGWDRPLKLFIISP